MEEEYTQQIINKVIRFFISLRAFFMLSKVTRKFFIRAIAVFLPQAGFIFGLHVFNKQKMGSSSRKMFVINTFHCVVSPGTMNLIVAKIWVKPLWCIQMPQNTSADMHNDGNESFSLCDLAQILSEGHLKARQRISGWPSVEAERSDLNYFCGIQVHSQNVQLHVNV